MAKLDVTRFDFYALRFMESESVQKMTAEECGQFVLLMCKAWLGGKAASLPNDPELLAKYVRCETVSPRVMAEWPEGDDGRLYNETLSEEWAAVISRAEHGRVAAEKRWDKVPNTTAAQSAQATHKVPSSQAKPSQAVSTQPKPVNDSTPLATGKYPEKDQKQDKDNPDPMQSIFSLAPELGTTVQEIERVYLYHWHHHDWDPFWKEKAPVPTVALFRKCWTTMLAQVPVSWTVPPAPAPKLVYDPACPRCGGEGGRNEGTRPRLWVEGCECGKLPQ